MPKPTIGCAIIVYNEIDTIGECIESIAPHVDQLVVVGQNGTTNQMVKAIRKASKKVEYYNFGDWVDDFAAKRNYSFSKLHTDWLLWIDSDDTVHHADNLREIAEQSPEDVGAVWFPYHYAVDEYGNVFTVYERERLLRAKYQWIWKGRLHETVQPLTPCKFVRNGDVIIRHNHSTQVNRNDRNFKLLNLMLKEDPTDKRVWLYLGHQNFASMNWSESAQWYLKFGTDEGALPLERYQALCYCSRALRSMNDPQAVDVANHAIQIYPQYRDAYLELAHSYLVQHDFDKAIHWAKMSDKKDLITDPPPLIFLNPLDYSFNKYCLLGDSYFYKNNWAQAREWFEQAYQVRPTKEVEQRLAQIKEIDMRQHVVDGIKLLSVHLLENKETARLTALKEAVPYWFRDMPDYHQLSQAINHYTAGISHDAPITVNKDGGVTVDVSNVTNVKQVLAKLDEKYDHVTATCSVPKQDKPQCNVFALTDLEELAMSKKGRHILNLNIDNERALLEYDKKVPQYLSVKFFLGGGLEHWNPRTIKTIGCGGSETAAAYIAKGMVKQDCQPLIYANDKQVWDGVIYRHYEDFKPESNPCHLFISSRVPAVYNNYIPAKQKYLWFHDVSRWEQFTPEIAGQIDALVVLSKWHANYTKATYPFLKDAEVIDFDNNPLTYEDCMVQSTYYADSVCSKVPKIAIIGNGIDVERFANISEARVPHRFIWGSAPDRGLEELLSMWPLIKKQLPDAELKIFYGWEYYDSYLYIQEYRDYKQKILKLVQQEGVEWCGRVGQDQFAKEMMKADVLLYPPHSFRETYGICFLEAQAAGTLCFYRENGALGETIGDRGVPIPMNYDAEEVVNMVVKTLADYDKCDGLRKAGREYAMKRSWDTQADKFLTLYKQLEV